MSFFSRYLAFICLFSRLAILGQDEPPVPVLPPVVAPDEAIEPPPAEPLEDASEVRETKPRRAQRLRPNTFFRHSPNHTASFGENILVKKDETVRQVLLFGGKADIQGTVEEDVVVIGGSATISGTVEGEVVVVGGTLKASGQIRRDAVVVLSRAELSDTARIGENAVFVGGPFKLSPSAAIMGERVVIPFGDFVPKIEWFKAWLVKGLLWGRLLPLGVPWAWMVAGFFLGLYLLTLVLFPSAIKAIFLALEDRPVTSIFSGFLTLILFAPLVALLVVAVVGIVVIPFVQIGLILALLFGKVGVMCFLGRSFGRSAGASFLQAPFGAFFIGSVILVLAYMIPIFGILAWALATVFGLGGAIVALSRTFKSEEANVPPAAVLASTLRPVPSAASASGIVEGPLPAPPISTPVLGPNDVLLLPRAGFWKRFLAALLDLILLGLLVPLLGKYFIPVLVVYFVAMWTWKGTTIGSLVLGLKVVRTDGRPVNFAVALVRCLSSFFSALVLFLGFLWTGWDREKQSWHDKIAGTVVVRMPKGLALV